MISRAPRGECEFMGDYAQPFAVLVISDLLGVPPEDRVQFREKLIRQEQERGGAGAGGVSDLSTPFVARTATPPYPRKTLRGPPSWCGSAGCRALCSRPPSLTTSLREGKLKTYSFDIIEGTAMNALKIIALALIAAGVLGLMYGGFSYTKKTDEAKIGPFELAVKQKETVNVPVWAGVGAIVVGAALLLVRKT